MGMHPGITCGKCGSENHTTDKHPTVEKGVRRGEGDVRELDALMRPGLEAIANPPEGRCFRCKSCGMHLGDIENAQFHYTHCKNSLHPDIEEITQDLPPGTWNPRDHIPPQRSYVSILVARQMVEAGTKGGVEAALLQNMELTGKLTNSEIARGILSSMLESLVLEVTNTGATEFMRGDLMTRCRSALQLYGR